MNLLDNNGVLYLWQQIKAKLGTKVDKVDGKGLSTNDLTSALKSNYDKAYTHSTSAHAPSNAQANVIETVKVNDTALTPSSKAVNIDLSSYAKTTSIPTKTSQLTNDSSFTTMSAVEKKGYQTSSQVNSIVNGKGYQTSSQVQSAINSALSGITGIDFQVVTSLPATGVKGTIYLIAHAHGTNDSYDEYIWITSGSTSKFEKIGNTDIDLSAYLKKADIVAITNAEIDTILAS